MTVKKSHKRTPEQLEIDRLLILHDERMAADKKAHDIEMAEIKAATARMEAEAKALWFKTAALTDHVTKALSAVIQETQTKTNALLDRAQKAAQAQRSERSTAVVAFVGEATAEAFNEKKVLVAGGYRLN